MAKKKPAATAANPKKSHKAPPRGPDRGEVVAAMDRVSALARKYTELYGTDAQNEQLQDDIILLRDLAIREWAKEP